MGKSEGNCVYLCEDPKLIQKKVMRALTDQGPTEPNSVKPDYIENLFTLMKVVSTPDTLEYFNEKWNTCEIRYGDMKKQLAADIINFTTPIRERYLDICNNEEYLRKVTKMGAEKARESAAKTIKDVRLLMGIRPF
jgi:tryptophanyl-tRNA synthetase